MPAKRKRAKRDAKPDRPEMPAPQPAVGDEPLPFEPGTETEGTKAEHHEFVRTLSKWDVEGVAAEIEERWGRPDEVALREQVAEWIGEGGTLLDVGCGSARIAPMLKGCEYWGVDGSAELLALARGRVSPEGAVRLHDLSDPLPFEAGEFDTVLCMNVLRHLDSYVLLKELRRVASKRVYIVDNFQAAAAHQYGFAAVAGQRFVDNVWSISLFLEAVAEVFPGWTVGRKVLPYVTGVVISAP
jgi:SAM-dependent methyltransferase